MGNNCCEQGNQQLKDIIEKYKNSFNDRKIKGTYYFKDLEEEENFVSDNKLYLSTLNNELSKLNCQLNISSSKQKKGEKAINIDEKKDLLNDFEDVTYKLNEFQNLSEKKKTLKKNLENNFIKIQKQISDIIDEKNKKGIIINNALIENTLKKQLGENQDIINKLEDNKKISKSKKIEIKNHIEIMQNMIGGKLTQIKEKEKGKPQKIFLSENGNKKDLNNSSYYNSSMLLRIKDFTNVKKQLETMYLFKENENEENESKFPIQLIKNWHEICIIKNDYDIHDITYVLKVVDNSNIMIFTVSSLTFEFGKSIDILLVQIDGKQANYKYEYHSLMFNINLKHLESNTIHIKYKEYPPKMTDEEKAFRNIYRIKEYGLSSNLMGRKAKFVLKNESDLEIINFENDFLIKTNVNIYEWGGIVLVPIEGKKTKIAMSKKEGIVQYYERLKIKTSDNSFIKDSNLGVPFCYIDGNNKIIKNEYNCDPKREIKLDKNEKIYYVNYNNTNINATEFILKGELKNKCRNDWIINLTKEQIDSMIPDDFKTFKTIFNKKANEIIKEYDEEHKNDIIIIPDVAKIGKWIKKNIQYDLNFAGMKEKSAYDTLINRRGVCDHITKLYNALVYSLGYQVLYANGFAMKNKNTFGFEDMHSWSLINMDKKGAKWRPFDATDGIFSGKLPVTHVFKQIGNKGPIIPGNAVIEQFDIKGSIK